MYKYFYYWKIKKEPFCHRPVVLVTGCSSGIGRAIAQKLNSENRYRLILTAREKSLGVLRQDFAESENLKILALDVASPQSRLACVSEIVSHFGRVDILVNNAGICYRSVLEEMQDSDELLQMQTNYLGPVSLVRLLLPVMRRRGLGKIVNISSVSGMLAMPTMASYSASKFALEGAMEALWYEARPFGVDVSLIQPGFVRSSSYERVKFSVRSKLSNAENRAYSDFYINMIPFVEWLMRHGFATPQSIAELVSDVLRTERPPLWIPASFDAELFYYIKRWFPRRFLMRFFYFLLPGSDLWAQQFSRVNRTSPSIKTRLRNLSRSLLGSTIHYIYLLRTLWRNP